MSLKGKVAIVAGANSGIGMTFVLELAKQGANIVIDYVAHPEATEAGLQPGDIIRENYRILSWPSCSFSEG